MIKQLGHYFLFSPLVVIINIYVNKFLLTIFDDLEFGEYRLLISIFAVISILSLKGTDWSIMRYTIDENIIGLRGALLKSIKFNSVAICILLLLTFLFFGDAFNSISKSEIILCLCIAFFNPLEFVFGALKGLEKIHITKISIFFSRLIFLAALYLATLINKISVIYVFTLELIILYIIYIFSYRISVLPLITNFNSQKIHIIYESTSSKFSIQAAISLICSHADKIILGAFSTSELGLLYLTTFLTDNIKSQLKPVFLMFSIRKRNIKNKKSDTLKVIVLLMVFSTVIASVLFVLYPYIINFISSNKISNNLFSTALILSCLSLIPYSASSFLASLDLIKNGAVSANIMIFQAVLSILVPLYFLNELTLEIVLINRMFIDIFVFFCYLFYFLKSKQSEV